MRSEHWSRVQDIVLGTLELEEPQRRDFLASECGNDENLREEVESLLAYENIAPDIIDSLSRSAFRKLASYQEVMEGFSKAELEELTGKTVSHYHIQEKLGEGGMGVVYKAFDVHLQRTVALKFLLRLWSAQLTGLDEGNGATGVDLSASYWEARAASALDHPNICTIYEVGQYGGVPFIAMQLLSGMSLKQRIDADQLSSDESLDIAVQITSAIDAAHTAGVIHRDIKPANIFITDRGEAKILDFGLAARTAQQDGSATGDNDLSRARTMAGTTAYMAPEQAHGQGPDVSSDIFSLGTVLYEMMTGVSPFRGSTAYATLDNILHKTPAPPSSLRHQLPHELDRIIARALAKDSVARYSTAAELNRDLTRLQSARHMDSMRAQLVTRSRFAAFAACAAILLALSAVAYNYFHHRPEMTGSGEHAVILGDFANATGDPIFDGTLRESLRVQLEQSPFLNVLTDSRLNRELGFMERPVGTLLTSDLARQLCLRTGSQATISGSIARIGGNFVLRISATGCQNEEPLGTEQIEVGSRETVLRGLDTIATRLRSRLGESMASIQAYDKPIEQATTPSLEALQTYSLGLHSAYTEGPNAAVPYYEKAIKIDPQFAMAYAKLGVAYMGLNSPDHGAALLKHAYDLRDRISDRERFYIDTQYYSYITGDQDKAVVTLKLWEHIYPSDPAPFANLGVVSAYLGHHQESLLQAHQALRLEPTAAILYTNIASEYCTVGQLDNCQRMIAEAQARKINYSFFDGILYVLDFLRGDEAGMRQQVNGAMGHPWVEGWLLAIQADTDAYQGRLGEARKYTAQAVRSARKYDGEDIAQGYMSVAALREAEFGNRQQARELAEPLLRKPSGQVVKTYAALALAEIGDTQQAQALARELHQQYPDDTLLNFYWLPCIEAAIATSSHDPEKAIRVLRATAPYEMGVPKSPTNVAGYPIYLRAEAYLEAGRGAEAEAEFRRLIQQSGLLANYPLGSLARLGLARAYRLEAGPARFPHSRTASDPAMLAKAKTTYADFLKLWSRADAGNPLLLQARAEAHSLPANSATIP